MHCQRCGPESFNDSEDIKDYALSENVVGRLCFGCYQEWVHKYLLPTELAHKIERLDFQLSCIKEKIASGDWSKEEDGMSLLMEIQDLKKRSDTLALEWLDENVVTD